MIYQFPDLDSLRLAITSSTVPPEVSLAPAVAGLDDEGHVWVQPAQELPREAQTALGKLGVQAVEASGALRAEEVCCWLQVLPVVRDPAAPALSGQLPVLFELPDPGQLSGMVGEMLRLGNDRQSFRWLKDPHPTLPRTGGGNGGGRVLLRVIGPPYYSLLRTLEDSQAGAAPRAYIERAPRVWVEIGHTHPLVEYLKPAAGQLLLLRPSRDWVFLDDAPFQDVYELFDYSLPAGPVALQDIPPTDRLKVPLQLAPGSSSEAAELWVLRQNAYLQIDTLVRESADPLVHRLAFAVSETGGVPTIVLRVRPSKQLPPALALLAESFRPYQKLPNLFMPVGQRLKPPLRRDVVRRLLADDPERIVWLYPLGEGKFVPESLPDAAFRPLGDWVEYVLDREHEAVQSWIDAARFEFADFICKDDARPQTPPPKQRQERERKSMLLRAEDETATAAVPTSESAKKGAPAAEALPLPEIEPSEVQKRLRALEARFLAFQRPLDDPERLALWPELARLNAAIPDRQADAAVCWLNAFWEKETPPADWLRHWAQSEAGLFHTSRHTSRDHTSRDRQGAGAGPLPDGRGSYVSGAGPLPDGRGSYVSGTTLDHYLKLTEPRDADVRALVACLLVGAWSADEAQQEAVNERLPQIQRFLERHEGTLGIRAVWLAWIGVAQLARGDVLGLARARDRLLERLLQGGLSPERDLPSFLRSSGSQAGERFHAVRERVVRLRELAHNWIEDCRRQGVFKDDAAGLATGAYQDLMFAFGFARLGLATLARRLQQLAAGVLGEDPDDVHRFLLEAFSYRVEQALAGKPHAGPLPQKQLEFLQDIVTRREKSPLNAPQRMHPYIVNSFREHSRILEPEEKVDATRLMRWPRNELDSQLTGLFALRDPDELEYRIGSMLKEDQRPTELFRVLYAALELAPRIREPFIAHLLSRLAGLRPAIVVVQDSHELEQRARLLERAVFLAAHYDLREDVQRLVSCFIQVLETQSGDRAILGLDGVAGQCLRSLRKLGLRAETDVLLARMKDLILQGDDLARLRRRVGAAWVQVLRTLLTIAAGWLYFGRVEQALPIIEEARAVLFDGRQEMAVAHRSKLASSYARTLGQAPVELALKNLEELFRRLGPVKDDLSTSSHFSRYQLQIVEAVVLAVASDDFAVGQNVRRWLDEDEYLVRRRIHRDLRAWMASAGL